MIMPGTSHASIADAAVNKRSTLIDVYIATIQQTQQKIPPHNIGLNLHAAPVINVGKPYSIKKSGATYSLNRKDAGLPVIFLYSSAHEPHSLKILLLIKINRKIAIPKPSHI